MGKKNDKSPTSTKEAPEIAGNAKHANELDKELAAPGSPFEPTALGRHSDDTPEDPDDDVDDDQGEDDRHKNLQGTEFMERDLQQPTPGWYGGDATGAIIWSESAEKLIEGIGQRLRDGIDEALELGSTREQIAYSAKILLLGGRKERTGKLLAGIIAYLQTKKKPGE